MKIKLLFIFLFLSVFANAQSGNWIWAKSAGGSEGDDGYSIITDHGGNVYVTGEFSSANVTFGSTTLSNMGASWGSSAIFIVKYDPNGNVIWAKSAGGYFYDNGYGIALDAKGNIFITGQFQSPTIVFGSSTLTNTGGGNGRGTGFIAKYDSLGNALWGKSIGDYADDYSYGVCTDRSGNVFITGTFQENSLNFGSVILNNLYPSFNNAFVAKYDLNGNVLWAKNACASNGAIGKSVSTDSIGNLYVTGSFGINNLIFESDTLKDTSANSKMFIAKYDTIGKFLWAKKASITVPNINPYAYGVSIHTDHHSNVCVAGVYTGSGIAFDSITLADTVFQDMFVAKYDSSGKILWANNANGFSHAYGVTTDNWDNVYVVGWYHYSIITFGSTTLTNGDIFIVKYDASGNFLGAKSVGGIAGDIGYSINTDENGNILVCGEFQTLNVVFGSTTLTNLGIQNIFVAKLNGVTGINEEGFDNSFLIYPNPTIGVLNIQSSNKTSQIEIYTLLGEKIYSSNVSTSLSMTNNVEINLDKEPNGIYFLQITTEKGIARKKVIISH